MWFWWWRMIYADDRMSSKSRKYGSKSRNTLVCEMRIYIPYPQSPNSQCQECPCYFHILQHGSSAKYTNHTGNSLLAMRYESSPHNPVIFLVNSTLLVPTRYPCIVKQYLTVDIVKPAAQFWTCLDSTVVEYLLINFQNKALQAWSKLESRTGWQVSTGSC